MKVLDLFSGCGGLSIGFSSSGFTVHGIDIDRWVPSIFEQNKIGTAEVKDLNVKRIGDKCDIIIGGPPCRPWSSINVRLRGEKHPDYRLLFVFFEHVRRLRPLIFIMENVLQSRRDVEMALREYAEEYEISIRIINYSEWGAAVNRKRMFVAGFRKDIEKSAEHFFDILDGYKQQPLTVRDVIGNANEFIGDPQNVCSSPKTIGKYMKYYCTGKYGWRILKWDEPAPSFGNITKTYILHPDSMDGSPPRVLTIREALCLMGFPREFNFPEGMGLSLRYQMIADAVSPVFSRVLAKSVLELFQK